MPGENAISPFSSLTSSSIVFSPCACSSMYLSSWPGTFASAIDTWTPRTSVGYGRGSSFRGFGAGAAAGTGVLCLDVRREHAADDARADQGEDASGRDQPAPADLSAPLTTAHLEALVGVNGLENRGQGPQT